MAHGLAGYKAYIDALVRLVRAPSYLATRLRRGEQLYPAPRAQDVTYNHVTAHLSAEQRALVADLIQRERQAAIGDVLDVLAGKPFGVTWDGQALAVEPFATEVQHDFIARLEGAPWPDERPAEEAPPS
ncbi:MAG TPA: DUF6547 family protein [Ktedonobacterales bacterium]|nr:DUF6547 family protein [Ktedonobacterales bacterium]